VGRLVVVESSLHVDAINGIVDAVLNVPEVAHESSLRRSSIGTLEKRELANRVPPVRQQ
jgi:hypothetical protein